MRKVLLVRPRYGGALSQFQLIRTEPLALEYLATVCAEEGHCHRYHDGMVHPLGLKAALMHYVPDVVAITGYVTVQDRILRCAELAREVCPNARVVVGGVHAEGNAAVFQNGAVDYVVHSDGIETFRRILRDDLSDRAIAGALKRVSSRQWVDGGVSSMDLTALPLPDRTHFLKHKSKFVYMDYGPVALAKMGYGCPHACSFCYCRLLHQGTYAARPMAQFIAEIARIEATVVWIVDDCFLVSVEAIQAFCQAVTLHCPDKRFIIYGRADFIASHPDVIPRLQEAGVIDVIVGFEAISQSRLAQLGKGSPADSGQRCVRLLAQAGIHCTGLFIAAPQDSKKEFKALNQWVHAMGLHAATLSVLTPIPGTLLYDQSRTQLTSHDWRHWDLMHLVLTPTQMSRAMFYFHLYAFYVKQLLRRPWQMKLLPRVVLRRSTSRRSIWDYWAKHYERLWVQHLSLGPTRARVIEQISVALDRVRGKDRPLKVLDMGCGTGQLIRDIYRTFPRDRICCTGVDYSAAMIAIAKEKDAKASYHVADVNDFVCDQTFDVIVCCHSFPYYPNQSKTLATFRALLKDQGVLLLAHASPRNAYDRLILRFVKMTTSPATYPSPDDMRALSRSLWGAPEMISIHNQPLVPTILLYCWRAGP